MYFTPIALRVNRGSPKNAVADDLEPVFSWGAEHEGAGQAQSAYRIAAEAENEPLWDSGWVESAAQEARYAGLPFRSGDAVKWTLRLKDRDGNESEPRSSAFQAGLLEPWRAEWITAPRDEPGAAQYYYRHFRVDGPLKKAVLYVCGIGYQHVTVNGIPADGAVLQPAHSNYAKHCYYVTLPVKSLLRQGGNAVGVIVGEGWRRNPGPYLKAVGRAVEFFGTPQLTAQLSLEYEDGGAETVLTDGTWRCAAGAVVSSNLYDGETYDAAGEVAGWDLPGFDGAGFETAVIAKGPAGRLRAQTVEPIRIRRAYSPISKTMLRPGVYIFDFGVNIAGFVELTVPAGTPPRTRITVRYAELLAEDGTLFTGPLRGAQATDAYISGYDNGVSHTWRPLFTYHGFRYIEVSGFPGIPGSDDFRALSVYTDCDSGSYFRCGSALADRIQEIIVQTERDNLHGIATDCPQRDERMGWLNDATVRFEETPYNFDIGRLYPKIVGDIMAEQGEDGEITCTAPFVYGSRPADPVCSSFLIAGMQAWLHTGNIELLARGYGAFCAWNEALGRRSDGGIVNYSYYGDWAGPADCCEGPENPRSAAVPGVLMSTGYHYYNYVLLSRIAALLGDEAGAQGHLREARRVRAAFLKRWWDGGTGLVANGSQGCQAFALWLKILPEDGRRLAAQRLHEAVEAAGYRLQTGNLTTRYLMDMLAEYGYIDDAWRIVTREEYPSWGYMIQNGATTVWERFELKKDPGMNSHNHPMYGAVGYWFYRYLAGVAPTGAGWETFVVEPRIPEKLTQAEAQVDTVRGQVRVKWAKRYGALHLHVDVPFGATAEIRLPQGIVRAGSGFHRFQWAL